MADAVDAWTSQSMDRYYGTRKPRGLAMEYQRTKSNASACYDPSHSPIDAPQTKSRPENVRETSYWSWRNHSEVTESHGKCGLRSTRIGQYKQVRLLASTFPSSRFMFSKTKFHPIRELKSQLLDRSSHALRLLRCSESKLKLWDHNWVSCNGRMVSLLPQLLRHDCLAGVLPGFSTSSVQDGKSSLQVVPDLSRTNPKRWVWNMSSQAFITAPTLVAMPNLC